MNLFPFKTFVYQWKEICRVYVTALNTRIDTILHRDVEAEHKEAVRAQERAEARASTLEVSERAIVRGKGKESGNETMTESKM